LIGLELGIGLMGTILFSLHARAPRSGSADADALDESTSVSQYDLRVEQAAVLDEAVRLLRFGEPPAPEAATYKPALLRHNGLSASRRPIPD
jgi:hypothetical protein